MRSPLLTTTRESPWAATKTQQPPNKVFLKRGPLPAIHEAVDDGIVDTSTLGEEGRNGDVSVSPPHGYGC